METVTTEGGHVIEYELDFGDYIIIYDPDGLNEHDARDEVKRQLDEQARQIEALWGDFE